MYKIAIPTLIVENSVDLALSRAPDSRGDFFHEMRVAFKENMEKVFESNGLLVNPKGTLGFTNYLKQGVHHRWRPITKYTGWKKDIKQELDLDFCARYGHDDYSLWAINYLDKTPASLPALSSLSEVSSIGNILLLVENRDCELEITLGDGIFSTGYAHHISKRKKKSYFCLFGVWFQAELLNSIIESRMTKHKERKEELDEVRLGTISYPILYIDRITGNLFTCSCFDGYFDVGGDIERLLPYENSKEGLRNRVKSIKLLNGICHLCCGGVPKYEYGYSEHLSPFMQRCLPYHELLSRIRYGRTTYRTDGGEYQKVEDEIRERFGYPKIGRQWVKEEALYEMIRMLFPDYEVIHHYRGRELEGLELDIWLPELKLGIEYQGEQHYHAIEHWGGKAGLEKRGQNDKKKKRLCEGLGYHLIEVKYTEKISEQLVRKKIAQLIEKQV